MVERRGKREEPRGKRVERKWKAAERWWKVWRSPVECLKNAVEVQRNAGGRQLEKFGIKVEIKRNGKESRRKKRGLFAGPGAW